MTPAERADRQASLIAACWAKGALGFLLKSCQRPIYLKIHEVLASPDPRVNSYVIDAARQFGKSFCMFLVAVELCLRKRRTTQVFIGPLKSQVNEIINGNTYAVIFATCPAALQPTIGPDSSLTFPNGSRIRLAGSDNKNYENLRGGAANTIFIDEAGYLADLTTGVLPTVGPMTKTTGGKVVFASTPPEHLDHDYYEVLADHEEQQLVSTYTIWDDTSLTSQQLEKIVHQCKGRHTTLFQREYECARIADREKQIIPELTKDFAPSLLLSEPPSFDNDDLWPYLQRYVVADWGGKDHTSILFAHYNHLLRAIIIEDHLEFKGSEITTNVIAQETIKKVSALWPGVKVKPRYYCDNNAPLIQQSMVRAGLPFAPTSKARLVEMVQKVRNFIEEGRIKFCPAAEYVLDCCQAAHWARRAAEFASSKTYGHYDALAAMVYLVRNVDEVQDPVPGLLKFDPHTQFMHPVDQHRRAQTLASKLFTKVTTQ